MHQRQRYRGKDIPIGGTAQQIGTLPFGTDHASSVLDLNCKTHELDNLDLADASFFQSRRQPGWSAIAPIQTLVRRLVGRPLSDTRGSTRCCGQIVLIAAPVALVYVFGVVR